MFYKIFSIVSLVAALGLTGCAARIPPMPAYGCSQPRPSAMTQMKRTFTHPDTVMGAVLGAVGGAAAEFLSGDNDPEYGRSVAAGAIAGGAAGAFSAYQDVQNHTWEAESRYEQRMIRYPGGQVRRGPVRISCSGSRGGDNYWW